MIGVVLTSRAAHARAVCERAKRDQGRAAVTLYALDATLNLSRGPTILAPFVAEHVCPLMALKEKGPSASQAGEGCTPRTSCTVR